MFPDALTTGVPSNVTLKSSGGLTITQPGTVVEGLDIHGSVTIAADNVTLKNCKISDSSYDTVLIKPGVSGAVVQNCDIDNQGSGGQALAGQGTFLNNNIHGAADGIDVRGSNTTIKDNFIHDLQGTSASHYDGIQADGNFSNVDISHNTVINDHGQTAALMLSNYWGPIDNTHIDNNLLVGGGYTVYLDEVADQPGGGRVTDLSFTNNHLGTGYYGTMDVRTELGDHPTMTGNVNDGATIAQSLHMTGQPSSDGSTSVASGDPGSATTGSGSSTTDGSGSSTSDGSGASTTDGSGTSASGSDSTSTSHDPGTSTSDSGTSASGSDSTSTSHDPGTSTSHDPGSSTSGSGTSASGTGSTSTSHDPGTSTSQDPGTSTSHDPGASTSGSGTSASGTGSTSTSHDPGTSTSQDPGTSASHDPGSTTDGTGTSASGTGSTSTSQDPGTSTSHDPGSSTSTGSGTQDSSSTGSSTSSHHGSGTSGSTSGHHSTSGSGSHHHWHHQSSDSTSTQQSSGTASDPTTSHSGSGHNWHGWNHDSFNFGSHNCSHTAEASQSSGSHQSLAQVSKSVYDHFADALNHASQAAHGATDAGMSGDTMTFKHGNSATQHHDMHLA